MPVLRIADGRSEDIREAHRAMVAQEQHPRVERPRDHRGEEPVAGHEPQPFRRVVLDRGTGRRRSLPADDLRPSGFRRVEDDWHLPARSDEMRLDDLENKGRGGGGVEGIAPELEHAHARSRCQPVRRRDDAEGAEDFRTGREHRTACLSVVSGWSGSQSRGSSASRNPSPSRLKARTITKIAPPGKIDIQGACAM